MGYTREQYKIWDFDYVNEIIFPKRNPKTGQPAFLDDDSGQSPRHMGRQAVEAQIRQSLWLAGYKGDQLEQKLQEAAKQNQDLLRQAGMIK